MNMITNFRLVVSNYILLLGFLICFLGVLFKAAFADGALDSQYQLKSNNEISQFYLNATLTTIGIPKNYFLDQRPLTLKQAGNVSAMGSYLTLPTDYSFNSVHDKPRVLELSPIPGANSDPHTTFTFSKYREMNIDYEIVDGPIAFPFEVHFFDQLSRLDSSTDIPKHRTLKVPQTIRDSVNFAPTSPLKLKNAYYLLGRYVGSFRNRNWVVSQLNNGLVLQRQFENKNFSNQIALSFSDDVSISHINVAVSNRRQYFPNQTVLNRHDFVFGINKSTNSTVYSISIDRALQRFKNPDDYYVSELFIHFKGEQVLTQLTEKITSVKISRRPDTDIDTNILSSSTTQLGKNQYRYKINLIDIDEQENLTAARLVVPSDQSLGSYKINAISVVNGLTYENVPVFYLNARDNARHLLDTQYIDTDQLKYGNERVLSSIPQFQIQMDSAWVSGNDMKSSARPHSIGHLAIIGDIKSFKQDDHLEVAFDEEVTLLFQTGTVTPTANTILYLGWLDESFPIATEFEIETTFGGKIVESLIVNPTRVVPIGSLSSKFDGMSITVRQSKQGQNSQKTDDGTISINEILIFRYEYLTIQQLFDTPIQKRVNFPLQGQISSAHHLSSYHPELNTSEITSKFNSIFPDISISYDLEPTSTNYLPQLQIAAFPNDRWHKTDFCLTVELDTTDKHTFSRQMCNKNGRAIIYDGKVADLFRYNMTAPAQVNQIRLRLDEAVMPYKQSINKNEISSDYLPSSKPKVYVSTRLHQHKIVSPRQLSGLLPVMWVDGESVFLDDLEKIQPRLVQLGNFTSPLKAKKLPKKISQQSVIYNSEHPYFLPANVKLQLSNEELASKYQPSLTTIKEGQNQGSGFSLLAIGMVIFVFCFAIYQSTSTKRRDTPRHQARILAIQDLVLNLCELNFFKRNWVSLFLVLTLILCSALIGLFFEKYSIFFLSIFLVGSFLSFFIFSVSTFWFGRRQLICLLPNLTLIWATLFFSRSTIQSLPGMDQSIGTLVFSLLISLLVKFYLFSQSKAAQQLVENK